eukprot:3498298-Pyramimonas_sp.AAC.1
MGGVGEGWRAAESAIVGVSRPQHGDNIVILVKVGGDIGRIVSKLLLVIPGPRPSSVLPSVCSSIYSHAPPPIVPSSVSHHPSFVPSATCHLSTPHPTIRTVLGSLRA